MTRCSRCRNDSIVLVRHSGRHLCEPHFRDFFEKRFAKGARGRSRLGRGSKVAVAISGGKDSVVLLRLLRKLFHDRTGINLTAVLVDEGIRGYRAKGVRVARRECARLGVPLRIESFRELFGITLDEIARLDPGTIPCSYCGVLRRSALNRAARGLKADRLALGHNLDDVAESILMNYVRGDVARLARMGPHDEVQPGLVPRMLPLMEIPEEEVKLYSLLEKCDVLEAVCPYAGRSQRGRFVRMLAELEDATPGSRHALLRGYESVRAALRATHPPARLVPCSECGEPSISGTCKACEMASKLKKLKRARRRR
jgi:uncharacterized protein (TIGR00269 family)